jgi:hypothetical protein
MSAKEKIYDELIAPKLMECATLCKEHGFAIACSVEWEPGETGRTEAHGPWNVDGMPSAKQKLVHWAARCNGNIDAFLFAVLKDANKNGHSSVFLKQLGCDNIVDTGGTAAFTITSPHP